MPIFLFSIILELAEHIRDNIKDSKIELKRAQNLIRTKKVAPPTTRIRDEAIRNANLELKTPSGSVKKFMQDLSGYSDTAEFEALEKGKKFLS